MAGKTIVKTETYERTLRWMKNEIQSLKNRMGGAVDGDLLSGSFEPALGDPAADGYVLSSTMVGVRSWVANGGIGPKLTAIEALASAAGWLHNDGAGVFTYSTPSYSDVGAAAVGHNHSGVYEPVLAAASPDPTLKYYRGDKSWQTLNQEAVAGLTTADGPTFDHLHITHDMAAESGTITKVGGSGLLTFTSYSTTLTAVSQLLFRKSASDTETITQTGSGDSLGGLTFLGVNSSAAFARGAMLRAIQNGASGASYVPTDLQFTVYDNATSHTALSLTKSGGVHVGGTTDVADNALLVDGAFGCNGAAVQTAYVAGAAVSPGAGAYGASSAANFAAMAASLSALHAALLANGTIKVS